MKPIFGVIGGTGIELIPDLEVLQTQEISTEYGPTSGAITIGLLNGTCVAFIPRHGPEHTIPPHKIPYKANLVALKRIGVKRIIATCVAGSLRENIQPGMFVLPDQFINFTWGRDDTFLVDQRFTHLPMDQPYCKNLLKVIIEALDQRNFKYQAHGTVVVIQGPRFSTEAESRMFAQWGGDLINMTQYPECYFAKELGLCYQVIATITDYDAGVPGEHTFQNVDSVRRVLSVFQTNTAKTLKLIAHLAASAPFWTQCHCAESYLAEYYRMNRDSIL